LFSPQCQSIRRSLILAAGVALACTLAGCAAPAPPPPPKPRVLFVGIDGATWKVIGRMLQRGELPAFRRLVEEGAWMPDFATLELSLSPVIWTTVATGRAPADHGVLTFTSELPNGARIPVTGSVRKARAIWELASRRGVSVGVIGWWASWPAERVNGYVVTDHANPALSDLLVADRRRYWTADRATLAALRRDVYPPAIAPILARYWISRAGFPYGDLQQRGGFSVRQMVELRTAPWNERTVYSLLKTFYRVDYPLHRAALDLARERPTDLQMLYLRGADPVQHYGWDLVEPEAFASPPPRLARDRGLVEGVYRYLDTFLAEMLAARHPESWLVVASDHGAEPAADAADPARTSRPGEHGPQAKGVLFVIGPHVRRGFRLPAGTPYDIMPTLAWLLGLPISQELPGRPLTDAFEAGFVRSLPVRRVATYGERSPGTLIASPADEAMLRSLRNLGYIQ
jgi:Type I phosphodiesterase / nucleotide pyrophosphatase